MSHAFWSKGEGLAGGRLRFLPGWGWRYGLAVVIVAGATGVRLALEMWIGPGLPPYLTYYPAIMVVALSAGYGPGVVATALTCYMVGACVMSPPGGFSLESPVDCTGMVVFAGMGLFMSLFAQFYRLNRDQVAAHVHEACLRESRERLATFAEATFEGIMESDAGWIVDCNEQLARMMGYTVRELRGMEMASLIAPDDRERVISSFARGRESLGEYAMQCKDGTLITVESHSRASSPGSARHHTALRDITKRKATEEALRIARKAALNVMQDAVTAHQEIERANAALRDSGVAERARRMELETLMEAIPTAVFIAHDVECHRITGNPAAVELLRLPPARHLIDVESDGNLFDGYEFWADGARVETRFLALQRAAATGEAVYGMEAEIVFPDGTKSQVIGNALPLFDDTGQVRGVIGAFMNITMRKLGQIEMNRLNRTLLALNESNRALLHATSEQELLREICRIITEVCGHAMAWIGLAENDPGQSVRPVASAGLASGYVESLHVSWGDNERGHGPAGAAIRSGQPNQCNDLLTDPRFAPWRDGALKHGFGSALGLPLLADGKAFGVVTIYSGQLAGFGHHEVQLLGDLAGELAMGITTLRLREARRLGELALQESEARFRSTFHNAATAMAVKRLDGSFLEVNQAYCEMLGFTEHELLDASVDDLNYPEDGSEAAGKSWSQLTTEVITDFRHESRFLHKCGYPVWCDTSVSLVCNPDGAPAYWIAQAHDITARKDAEEALLRSERYARSQWAEAETALESFPANIAILDVTGTIVRVNTSWNAFARQNGGEPSVVSLGVNYLEVCDAVLGVENNQSQLFAAGIRSVISGQRERFTMEYPCHSPTQQRWFIGYVTVARGEGLARAVVAHVDITAQKRIEEKIRILNQQLETRVAERTNELLATVAVLEAEIGNRQRLEREILEISEREQSRLGQDLHDGLGQELSGIAVLGDVLAKELVAQAHPSSEAAVKIAAYVRGAIDSTRRLAKGHYPVELDRYGLLLAIKDLAAQTTIRTGIECELCQYGADPQLAKAVEIHLYRIVQECIGNAIKHAQPRKIIIASRAGDGSHTFSVTDDGIGFDHSVVSSGMGLHLMEYRARVIGAMITMEQPPTGGCRISCRLDL